MPELPDVEAFKNYYESKALHKKIERVEIKDSSILKIPAEEIREKLMNKKLGKSIRIGKNLLIPFKKDNYLVLHFGMTGYLEYFKVNGVEPKYSKLLLYFDNDHCLSVINKRKLGYIDLTNNLEQWRKDKDLGPDALDLHLKQFREIIGAKKGKIKAALTDQSAIAGIGNIYADEILFQSKIHPELNCRTLGDDQVKNIFNKMKQVLDTAIKNDAQPDRLPSHYLIHHRQDGDDCPGCNGKVTKIMISGRSTYLCEECQKR